MGKFACHCGYVISDSSYPCPWSGELRWETELEKESQQIAEDLKDCLDAVEKGKIKDWVKNYFGDVYPFPLDLSEIIDDIYLKNSNKQGRNVLRCTKCERIYIQKEFCSNEWTCYEKLEQETGELSE